MKLPANKETWKPIKGYEEYYEVSDLGRVISLRGGIILKPGRSGYKLSYRQVHLSVDGVCLPKLVHRLVLEAFVGPCPDGMEACHNNGIGSDNRLINLRWDSSKNNKADRRAHGTVLIGGNHQNAKLTESDVRRIFSLRSNGHTYRAIAKLIGVSPSRVCRVVNRKEWQHVVLEKTS